MRFLHKSFVVILGSFEPDTIPTQSSVLSVRQKEMEDGAYWLSSLLKGAMEIAQVGYAGPSRRPVAVSGGQLQQMEVELESLIKVFYGIFFQLTPAERALYHMPASALIQ